MKRALLVALVLVFAASVVLTGCAPKKQYLSIATGGTGGVYYPLGGGLAKILNENIKGMEANVRSTGASVANVNLLAQAGSEGVEIAFIQNDITYYAYTGTEMFQGKKNDKIRGIATLYPEVVQIIATEASGIKSVKDLAGKRVAVGAQGSGVEANARQIVEAFGLSYKDFAKTDYLSFAEATSNMKDGHIDAAFVTSGIPTAAVVELFNTTKVNLVTVSGPEVDALRAKYPFYSKITIPANTYKDQSAPVETIAVMAMIVCKADLTEKQVYDITKALFTNLKTFGDAHVRGKDLTINSAQNAMPIPLHPGAEKFFKEQKK